MQYLHCRIDDLSKLVSALKAQNSDIQIEGMAGERMLEAGCVQLWDKNLANVMGFAFMIISFKAGMVTFWLREILNKLGT
jgi:lipid A disaccharide synthetase